MEVCLQMSGPCITQETASCDLFIFFPPRWTIMQIFGYKKALVSSLLLLFVCFWLYHFSTI